MGLFNRFRNESIQSETVTSDGYSEQIGFYAKAVAFTTAVSCISNIFTKSEIKHFKRNEETGKLEEVKDKIYYLLNVSPNDNQSASKFKSDLIFNLFFDNESLMFSGNGEQFYVASSYSRIKNGRNPDYFSGILTDGESGVGVTRRADNVAFFQLDNRELSNLIQMMLTEYTSIISSSKEAIDRANSELWKLKSTSPPAGDEEFQKEYQSKMQKSLKAFLSSKRAVFTQPKGYELEKLFFGDGKVDVTAFQSAVKGAFELTAQALKMPVSILNGNMTNVNDILNGWASISIDPLFKMISEVLTKALVSYEDWEKGEKIVVDTSMLFHMDWFQMCEKGDKGIASGIASIDEVRLKMGEEPLETEQSICHYLTKNYDRIENAAAGS